MTSKRNGRLLAFFKIELPRTPKAKEIFSLKRLNHFVITVETVRTPKKAIRYNCNLWHHFSWECNLPTVCRKCSGKHASSECTVVTKENPDSKPKCNNCGLEHVSSYRGWKAFPFKPQFQKKTFAEATKGPRPKQYKDPVQEQKTKRNQESDFSKLPSAKAEAIWSQKHSWPGTRNQEGIRSWFYYRAQKDLCQYSGQGKGGQNNWRKDFCHHWNPCCPRHRKHASSH